MTRRAQSRSLSTIHAAVNVAGPDDASMIVLANRSSAALASLGPEVAVAG